MAANELFRLAGRLVWVAGHRGMVGSAIMRRLEAEDCEMLTVGRGELDLRRQADVEAWMEEKRPEIVFLAAANVGGILANDTRPADFLYDNLAIEANVIHGAHSSGVAKLIFLGSACIYPRLAAQPMAEDALLTGPLEPTNQWYAIAKIAGIHLCQAYRRQHGCDFISAMPNNLYGPGDSFDLESAHVIPALMRKLHEAKEAGRDIVEIWGSGKPLREFLHVDDLADALVFLTNRYSEDVHVNVGTGEEISISDLAAMIADVVGYEGGFRFNTSRPDGTPRKILDVSRLTGMGWQAKTGLRAGLEGTYGWFLEQGPKLRGAASG
jgi:GDP-L-fucose synthase